MWKKRFVNGLFLVAVVILGCNIMSAMAKGDEVKVKQRLAGSIFGPVEFSGGDYSYLNLTAKGAPGAAHIQVVGMALPATPTGACPGEQFELTFIDGSVIETFSDLSMLTFIIDQNDGAVNYLCVDFATGNSKFEFDYVIIGGSGRFAGASGKLTVAGSGWTVGPFLSAEGGTLEGTILLP